MGNGNSHRQRGHDKRNAGYGIEDEMRDIFGASGTPSSSSRPPFKGPAHPAPAPEIDLSTDEYTVNGKKPNPNIVEKVADALKEAAPADAGEVKEKEAPATTAEPAESAPKADDVKTTEPAATPSEPVAEAAPEPEDKESVLEAAPESSPEEAEPVAKDPEPTATPTKVDSGKKPETAKKGGTPKKLTKLQQMQELLRRPETPPMLSYEEYAAKRAEEIGKAFKI